MRTVTLVPIAVVALLCPSILASTDACGQIQSSVDAARKSSDSTATAVVDASVGIDCLNSIPIDNQLATSFLQEVKKYVEFQSNLAYTKSPPPGYWYDGVDVLGQLDELAQKATNGSFSSQYEVDQEILALVNSAKEPHLVITSCTGGLINFERPLTLVSISEDGIKSPLIYNFDDLPMLAANGTVSSIASINGQNATEFLQQESLKNNPWDPDSSYNNLFWSSSRKPSPALYSAQFTVPRQTFPGLNTTFSFANGTVTVLPNKATIDISQWPDDISDGESLFRTICTPPTAASSPAATSATASATSSATPTTPPPPPQFWGHPMIPVIQDPYGMQAGYFLNGSEYQDVAVLWVFYYEPTVEITEAVQNAYPAAFQNTTRQFLEMARAANKTKLIIDVTGNGGGDGGLALDLVERLFPTMVPYEGIRMRMPPAAQIISTALSNRTVDELLALSPHLGFSSWYLHGYETLQGGNVSTWEEFFPPNVRKGDNMSAVLLDPWSNPYWASRQGGVIPYGDSNPADKISPFALDDILILTDGICNSACAMLVEPLRHQGKVKSIAFGGLPGQNSMQAVGGTRGLLASPFSELESYSQLLVSDHLISGSQLALGKGVLPGVNPLPLGTTPEFLAESQLNARDWILPNQMGGDQVPQQFFWEPAECHVYFTADTVKDPSKMWEYAANAAWNNGSCAWGNLQQTIDLSVPHSRTEPSNSTSTGSAPTGPQSSGAVSRADHTYRVEKQVWGFLVPLIMAAAFF